MEHRVKIIGIALLCVAFGSEALTLGRVRGAALIGQPLDMVVQVQMDAGEDASSLCFDADVFHADTRQDGSRVRVLVEATAQAHLANVRVLSSTPVDEPVVTVYLRTGCGQKTTRRYVLLADLPSEVAAPLAPLVVPAVAPAKVDLTRALPVSADPAKTVQVPKQTVPRSVDNKRPVVKTAVVSSKGAMADEKSKAGRSAGQARLKLDPLELLSDRVANLDSYMTFTPPEDALRNMQKTLALEESVKTLLALSAKNEASVMDLKARLQKAESERFPDGLVYGLIALVLACLAGVAFLWNRQRRVPVGGDDWWSGSIAAPAPASAPPETDPGLPPRPVTARKELTKASAVDVSMIEMSDSNFDDLMQAGVTSHANRNQPPPPAKAVPPRKKLAGSLNSAAMLAIRQQAKSSLSRGQTDEAVRILKKNISDGGDPNPFVYLDLLSIFHSISLRTDFQLLRENFNRLFRGRVPEFAFFKEEGRGLESYPDVLSRITALWPTPKVLGVIEACMLRDPQDDESQSFDLAAFRDLLLLHAVAQNIVHAPPLEEVHPPRELDLDLSEWSVEGLAASSVSAADVDLPLPLLMPDDHEADGQGARVTRPLDDGNLVDFDFPATLPPPDRR